MGLVLGKRKAVPLRHRREAVHVFRRQKACERRVAHAFKTEQQRLRHAAVHLTGWKRHAENPVRLAKRQAGNPSADHEHVGTGLLDVG